MNLQLKDVLHFYLGCKIRIKNPVTDGFSNWKDMSLRDVELVTIHGQEAQVMLREMISISEKEAFELAKIYDPNVTDAHFEGETAIEYVKGGRYVNSIWSISSQPSKAFFYLLSKKFDLFNLISTGQAIGDSKKELAVS